MKYFWNKGKMLAIMLVLVGGFSACEDVVDVDLDQGQSQLAVDAFLFNITGKSQHVRLTRTAPYFANKPADAVSNAFVTLIRPNGRIDTLKHNAAVPGNYILDSVRFEINKPYTLRIAVDEQFYAATTTMRRVCPIDSLVDTLRLPEFGRVATRSVALYARDLVGLGDRYWFRVFKNGKLYDKADEIVTSADGSLGPNAPADGLGFIRPIRESLNRPNGDDLNTPIYKTGDKVRLELCSIDETTFNFIAQAIGQITNGGLFATPPANVVSNIVNTDVNGKKAVGWFSISNVSVDSLTMK